MPGSDKKALHIFLTKFYTARFGREVCVLNDLSSDASMLLFFMQMMDNYDINWFISQAPEYVDVVAMRDAFNELKAKGYIPH